ncbi:MAG: sigma-70 family RNA polymerase sigma factor [Spirochaetes bacterium]|jgi:RNA polymerase sigma-70 factor (ECF subfamily)|nr:sigma-70 family RNA polymerase sigma factor [Spirochaetota bacterium]
MVSEKEFAEIVGATKKVVLSAIARQLPPEFHNLIDDVAQETYIRAYRALVKNRFKGESQLSTWLYSIARNEALRMLKKATQEEAKREKERKRREELLIKQVGREVTEERDAYDYYISLLPDIQKEVVDLFLKGFSEKEMASRLSVARGTVKSRLSRARESLARLRNKEEYNE